MEDFKLTEEDFNNLIDAVGLWGKMTPSADDAAASIIAKLFSDGSTDRIEQLLKEKKAECERSRKQRERDAAMLSTKLILIQRAFMDKGTFNLDEHLK